MQVGRLYRRVSYEVQRRLKVHPTVQWRGEVFAGRKSERVMSIEWCTCEHGYGAHEFGLCQVVIGEWRPGSPKLCPCRDPLWNDD
jgi:hypothetical protein